MHYIMLTRACHSHSPLQSRTLATERELDLCMFMSTEVEFACAAKAVKIKSTWGTTAVYSSNYTLDKYRLHQSLKEVCSPMERNPNNY